MIGVSATNKHEGLGWGRRVRKFAKGSRSHRHVAMKGRLACDCHGASCRHGVAKRSSPSMPTDRQLIDTLHTQYPSCLFEVLSLVKHLMLLATEVWLKAYGALSLTSRSLTEKRVFHFCLEGESSCSRQGGKMFETHKTRQNM